MKLSLTFRKIMVTIHIVEYQKDFEGESSFSETLQRAGGRCEPARRKAMVWLPSWLCESERK